MNLPELWELRIRKSAGSAGSGRKSQEAAVNKKEGRDNAAKLEGTSNEGRCHAIKIKTREGRRLEDLR